MKIRDLILAILVISVVVNSAILVSYASSKVQKISDVTTKTSVSQLTKGTEDNMENIAIGLRDSLDEQLKNQYLLVKSWSLAPSMSATAKSAQERTKEQLYEMWSAEKARVYIESEATGDGNPLNDLDPATSLFLIGVSKESTTFPEIFLTDNRGYAIAANVATGDFDQGPDDWRVFLVDGKPVMSRFKPTDEGEGWYKSAIQAGNGLYISNTIFDESSRTWGLEIVTQVRDSGTNEYLGQLKAVFDFSKFVSRFLYFQELKVDHVQIIDSEGKIIADSGESTGTDLKSIDSVLLTELRQGKVSGTIVRADSNGEKVLTAYAISNDKNKYAIAVSKRYSDIEGPISLFVSGLKQNIDNEGKALVSSILLIAIIVGIATLAVSFALINARISKPIAKLTAVSDKLSKGDIKGLEVNITGKDEIGQLGEGFKGVLAAFNVLNDEINLKKRNKK